jgi:hypothetical protein
MASELRMATILPPPFDSEPPSLVEFDPVTPSWNQVLETARETWRPSAHESDGSEAYR